MARTIQGLTPGGAECKSTVFPSVGRSSDASGARPFLAYDASLDEAAYWTFPAPVGLTAPYTLVITYAMASATANAVVFDAAMEAVASGDGAPNFLSAESLDSVNTAAADTVPGTAGLPKQVSVVLANNDSVVAGDIVRLRIRRVGSSGSDTATGDAQLYAAELKDSG